MRIAFVSTMLATTWGGADVLWTRTAARALAAGHEVMILVSPRTAAHPRVKALVRAGAVIHTRSRLSHQQGRRDRWSQTLARIFRLRSSLPVMLDDFKPDFVFICQGGVFDFLADDGLVRWLHATGCRYCAICQSNDERERIESRHLAPAREFFARASHTVFVSSHNRDLATRQSGAAVPRAVVVPNPVEIPLDPVAPWPAADRPRLAVVARLEADPKGLDVLLQALARLDRRTSWHLTFHGRGPDEGRLREESRRLGLGDRLAFAGFAVDIRTVWARHHVLVLPSRREGCALAMLEALACGRPVLTTECGGARDWVEPGRNGWICTPGDPEALAATMTEALADYARWPEYGAAARRIFTERHVAEPETVLLNLLTAP